MVECDSDSGTQMHAASWTDSRHSPWHGRARALAVVLRRGGVLASPASPRALSAVRRRRRGPAPPGPARLAYSPRVPAGPAASLQSNTIHDGKLSTAPHRAAPRLSVRGINRSTVTVTCYSPPTGTAGTEPRGPKAPGAPAVPHQPGPLPGARGPAWARPGRARRDAAVATPRGTSRATFRGTGTR